MNRQVDTEKQKSEDLARLINNCGHAVGKTTDLVDKSELVKLPDDFKPPTILPVKEIKK